MATIAIQVPDIIVESHQNDLDAVKAGVQQGLVIWEYLSGNLSLEESGHLLKIGYRGFLELLWSKGIPPDGLSEAELQQQVTQIKKLLKTS